MEKLHDIVLNVHGAVACACHQNVSLTGSITQLNDTDHPRMTSSFSADARSVMTGHSEFSVTVCRAVNFPSSEQLHGLAFERDSGEL